MLTITKTELLDRKREFLKRMKEEIFIYPTDTIYGIGCDATNIELVKKLRIIKKRFEGPFSVIAPSKEWIRENCEVKKDFKKCLDNLPGPYTIILKLNNKEAISKDTNLDGNTLGVRIPDHWISDLVNEFGKPIITTSANVTAGNFMTNPEEISPHIKENTDFLIDEGIIEGKPSTIVKCIGKTREVLRP